MPQLSFRVSDDVAEEFQRGTLEQGCSSVDYFSALVLRARGRVSGLSEPVWEAAATDARLSGAVANAVAAIGKGDTAEATRLLRFAQRLIIEALAAKRDVVDKATSERIGIKGGGDDWAQAERQ